MSPIRRLLPELGAIRDRARSHRYLLLVLTLITGAYLIVSQLLGAGLVDDAYIFLRYARNFATGHGLVFNLGERVEGYTSPLWVFCLGLVSWLRADLEPAAMVLSACFGIAIVFVLYYAGRRWTSAPWPVWMLATTIPAWFLVTNPAFVYWTWSGMDTSIFTFLLLTALVLFLKDVGGEGTLRGAGLFFSLAALARIDILVLLPLYMVGIYYFNRRQKHLLLRKYVSFLLPMLLLVFHVLWRYYYYGSWLPNTFYAKTGLPLDNQLQSGLSYTLSFAQAYAPYLIGVLVCAVIAMRAGRASAERASFLLAAVIMWTGYVISVGGDHFANFRFFVPIMPVLAFSGLLGLDALFARIPSARRLVSFEIFALLLLLVVLQNWAIYGNYGGNDGRGEVETARYWSRIGTWLKHNVPSDATIACMVVGAIPYQSDLKTYDLLGLTDREIALHGKVYIAGVAGHQKYDTDYIISKRPTYIVYTGFADPLDPYMRGADKRYFYSMYDLVNDPRTQAAYELQNAQLESGERFSLLKRK